MRCVGEQCERQSIARGFCGLHYQRWKRIGYSYKKKPHGHAPKSGSSKEYRSWTSMIQRCKNPKATDYRLYGGRGITVCERWLKFENFLTDMGERPSVNHSLDRFPDKNGNYEPGNCRWATAQEQNRNTRTNRLITIDNVTRPMCEWVELSGLKRNTVQGRIRNGLDIKTALTMPIQHKGRGPARAKIISGLG